MPFLELSEHVERPTVRGRRFFVNLDRVSYVAALRGEDHAILVFDDRTRAIVVEETWDQIVALIDQEDTSP